MVDDKPKEKARRKLPEMSEEMKARRPPRSKLLKPLDPAEEKYRKAIELINQLLSEFSIKNRNLEAAGETLAKLKIHITGMNFLPLKDNGCEAEDEKMDIPEEEPKSNKPKFKNDKYHKNRELRVAREMLEIGALYSLEIRDIPAFHRYIAQLKPYHFDYREVLPHSYDRVKILGLNLMSLLAEKKFAEFHTEVERFTFEEMEKSPFITQPLKIERCLMEGRYNRILCRDFMLPVSEYRYFMELIRETVRDEIAANIESAYKEMKTSEIQRLMSLQTAEQLKEICSKHKWDYDENVIVFPREEVKEGIPSKEVTEKMLEYACDLEMII